MAEAVEWSEDTTGAEFGHGSLGYAFGRGYVDTDGTSYGHYENAGNGWGYSYADSGGRAMGHGGMYEY